MSLQDDKRPLEEIKGVKGSRRASSGGHGGELDSTL